MKNIFKLVSVALALILLISCGPGQLLEVRVYGVRESVWPTLSSSHRAEAIRSYNAKQKLLEEQRIVGEAARIVEHQDQINNQNRLQSVTARRRSVETFHPNSAEQRLVAEAQRRSIETHRQEQANSAEQRSVAEAQRRSIETHRQEQANRNTVDWAIGGAKRRSMETYRQEQANSAQERALVEAKSRSVETYRQEQANSAEQRAVAETQRRSIETHRQEQANRNTGGRVIEEANRRSMETYRQEQTRRNVPTANWVLNEGMLVRGGQLVMDLQRELGRSPRQSETTSRLASRMGLTHGQAGQIIDELGLY